ncbi:MAG: pilus assembly protein N-terminal domain-containing protein, partial [Pseudomonadota bacterium]
MTFVRAWKAVLAASLMLFGPMAQVVQAQNLQVVREGMSRSLNVVMNQAVVVESDVPFAELSIANPAIADLSTLSDRSIYVLGKSPGRTTLTILDASGRLITNVDVRVSADVVEFKERLRQILPNERIEVRTANDGIVLSGTVSSTIKMDRALELAQRYAPDRVSNLLSVSGKQQVMLKVRFAEMQRTVSKQLSTSLGIINTSGDTGVIGESGTFLNGDNTIVGPVIQTQPGIAGAIAFGFEFGSTQLGVLLEALESKGVVRSLAEPNLTALSGQEATFLAGGEFPIPVAADNGNVGIEFNPFGVELNFVPRVLDDKVINLE